jgi:outer membrane protein OmpA-like peptidoglycan-associated protein
MAEVSAVPDLPSFPVQGEHAPVPLLATLLALGVLMGAGAVGLARDEWGPARQRLQVAAPAAGAVGLASPVAASQAATEVATPSNTQTVAQAAMDVTPIVKLPACPEAVSIFFPTARATPEGPDAASELIAVVAWAQANPNARLLVEGHADTVGGDESNVLLSFTRAKAVAALLAAGGVPAQQLQVTAAGSQRPISGMPGGARENRRATVQIHDPDGCKTTTRQTP